MTEPRDTATEVGLLHMSLSYLLAGDSECRDALDTLSARIKLIDWSDPGFIHSTREMQWTFPGLTAEQQQQSMRSVPAAVLFAAGERLASSTEDFVRLASFVKRMAAQADFLAQTNHKVIDYLIQVLAIHQRSVDRLEMLGNEVASYQLPEFPSFPLSPDVEQMS